MLRVSWTSSSGKTAGAAVARFSCWCAFLLWWLSAFQNAFAESWRVRVEEPTGIYPRTNELVTVPYAKIGGEFAGWEVVDEQGRELPWQAVQEGLLFPATLIPGELPEFEIRHSTAASNFLSQVKIRKLGLSRIELGNRFFRAQVDLQAAAFIEVLDLDAGDHRVVNLVETTPEEPEALKDDIHAAEAMGIQPVPGMPPGNGGWTSTGGTGPFTNVEILEDGPLRGKIRLSRTNETWELCWAGGSRALEWRANGGFRFTAISAAPYVPFDRFVGVSEYEWPNGPDDSEPPDHEISPRSWKKLPAGYAVYYNNTQNYGALGIVALDTNLVWTGIGSRRFVGQSAGATSILLTFPEWAGSNTVLNARREFRVLRQPLLVMVEKSSQPRPARRAASRVQQIQTETVLQAPATFKPLALSLDGAWELAWCDKGQGPPSNTWRTVKVPGSAHTQWLSPDEIYGHSAEWISSKEWWYRKRFPLPKEFRDKRLRLQFDATDYYADAWLNDVSLGRHEGYIDPYEYEVSGLVSGGETNELFVRTWTPVNYYWKHRSYTVKGAYGAVDQKPDNITPLGVTRSVRLVASDGPQIQNIAVDTRLTGTNEAVVAIDLDLENQFARPVIVELTLSPRNFSSSSIYRASSVISNTTAHAAITVPDPHLWWTWDHGRPDLYNLDVRLRDVDGKVLDGRTLAVGIREIERIGWTFYLNRRRMFIRGTNYYYHLYLSEMDRAAYARDLGLIQKMNVNLIRLHCHFDNPEFYDIADELGLLVWQDYLEAWYPEDRAFSLRAAELYDPLIRAVRNHACVASWTACDEESLENYRDLTKHLAARPALLDPQRRPIVRSTGRFGDAHVYHGWYDGSIWEYTNMTEPFVSELGATCLPNYSTLSKFMAGQWPIRDHPDEWFFRRLQIPEAIRAWGDPGDATLEDYIPRTQAYVSRLFQIALERSRRLKYRPAGGICHFHVIDIWPSVTMAAIDFDRAPTQVFYTVQRSFAPVCASLEYDRDVWKTGQKFRCAVWVINDQWVAVRGASIRWRIVDAGGAQFAAGQWHGDIAQDSVSKIADAEWIPSARGAFALRAQVLDANGASVSENEYSFSVTE
ncbi:MAG TPA: hypothetical protein VKY92_06005 [Verrucomicrobiae bacterium]|nr:hypothetical protein [Verrucomicrobiae bacterium]